MKSSDSGLTATDSGTVLQKLCAG